MQYPGPKSSYAAVCLTLVLVVKHCVVWVASKRVKTGVDDLSEALNILDSMQENELEDNPFIHGNYAPVAQEQRGLELEVVAGALPEELDGMFVRNGPNPIPGQMSKRYLWIDGHGMLHNICIKQGKALYSNTYVRTPRYEHEAAIGQEVFLRLGEVKGYVGVLKLLFFVLTLNKLGIGLGESGTANTQTVMFGNRFYALQETNLPFEVRLHEDGSVESLGYDDFDGKLIDMSAHPKVDHITGNLIFNSYEQMPEKSPLTAGEYMIDKKDMKFYIGVNPLEKYISVAHDFMFTKNYLVIYDNSVQFSIEAIGRGGDFLSFNDTHSLRIGLIPRKADVDWKEVQWHDTKIPLAMMHPLNAWEDAETGEVILWSPVFSFNILTETLPSNLEIGYMVEFTMSTKSDSLDMRIIDDNINVEFCRVRDECYGIFCQYGYAGILSKKGSGLHQGFTIWDMAAKELCRAIYLPPGYIGQEPQVIPKPQHHNHTNMISDMVYIGLIVHDTIEQDSYFFLYDGRHDSDCPLIAKLRFPVRVPYGFHSQWVPGKALRAHIAFHDKTSKTRRNQATSKNKKNIRIFNELQSKLQGIR